MISGFTPANMGTWMGYQPDPIFMQHCPPEVKALMTGEQLYTAQLRSRRLGEALGARSEELEAARAERAARLKTEAESS